MADIKRDTPFVLVRCMTYNHEMYIEDALKSFVMQKTDFPFVVSIIDDASTDNNASVITDYLRRVCDADAINSSTEEYGKVLDATPSNNSNCLMHVVLLNENHYCKKSKRPYYIQFEEKAKYIAMCEGDDYWTDPLKLQKQVDILEKDESLMMCCTNCSVVDNHSVELHAVRGGVVKDDIEGRYNLRDFFDQGHQYPTLSVLYRNTHRDEVRQKTNAMRNPYMGDWTLWIALLCFGDMYYLDEVTCAYRINPTSLTHDQSKMNQRRLGQAKDNFRLIPLVASCLPDDYQDKKDDLINNTAWMWYRLAIAYKHVGQYFRMAYALLRCELKDPGYVRREISLAKKKL